MDVHSSPCCCVSLRASPPPACHCNRRIIIREMYYSTQYSSLPHIETVSICSTRRHNVWFCQGQTMGQLPASEDTHIREFIQALTDETDATKRDGGSGSTVFDGQFVR